MTRQVTIFVHVLLCAYRPECDVVADDGQDAAQHNPLAGSAMQAASLTSPLRAKHTAQHAQHSRCGTSTRHSRQVCTAQQACAADRKCAAQQRGVIVHAAAAKP